MTFYVQQLAMAVAKKSKDVIREMPTPFSEKHSQQHLNCASSKPVEPCLSRHLASHSIIILNMLTTA